MSAETTLRPLTEAQLETLSTALDSYNRLDLSDDGSVAHAKLCIRAQNILLDACYDCGMPHEESEFEFAARTVALWLGGAI